MPRRRPTSIAALIALCCLAAGVQALAPASAGAMTDQTTCLNMPIPGVGLVPGMGVAIGPDGQAYACKLDSGGAYYGGTGKKDSTPTQPICGRNCIPQQIGGSSGSGSGSGEAPGPRPGGPPAKGDRPDAYKKMQEENKEFLEKRRREELAKMDPGEREVKRFLCQILQRRKWFIDARKPPNYAVLADYDRRKSIYEHAKKAGLAWGQPDWVSDRTIEAQLPAMRRYIHDSSVNYTAMQESQCQLFQTGDSG
jgi:hypothetical protein